MPFTTHKLIRFSHCDPAGIGFYPRYVELANEIVEDWFAEGLGVSFQQLIGEQRLAIPAVHLEIDYLAPSTYGDVLDCTLRVQAIGRTSFTLEIAASCAGEARFQVTLKSVLVDLDGMRALPLNDEWRARFAPYQSNDGAAM